MYSRFNLENKKKLAAGKHSDTIVSGQIIEAENLRENAICN